MDKNSPKSRKPVEIVTITNTLFKHKVEALLIRSTDQYFNEYVPAHLSARVLLSGFDGSVGDVIITKNEAHLFVDGRYSLQAQQQAKNFTIHVTDAAQSIESCWLLKLPELLKENDILAYDSSTVDLQLWERINQQMSLVGANAVDIGAKIIQELLGDTVTHENTCAIWKAPETITGRSCQEKIKMVSAALKENKVDAFLVVKLDDIAWLTNLRSNYFPFQTTLPALACVFVDRILLSVKSSLAIDQALIPKEVTLVHEDELIEAIKPETILGMDGNETSKSHELALRRANIEVRRVQNPIAPLKAVKNEKELLHFRSAFKKADHVVYQTQNFVIDACEKNQTLTEADIDRHIRDGFKKSGAIDQSFRPICAGGKNGAIIHYGTPNHHEKLSQGVLFLLDTGAYYEGGYATDLTRTFLVGKTNAEALAWQKEMFTLVLQASIAGLSARLRRGSLGIQLDAIVRAPLYERGLDFAHGTGHGVGINVHEFPPRVALTALSELLEGHVFSIEPGLYFENLGGVRIENLVTIVKDPDNKKFMRVQPLTFCPLDERLIDYAMLTEHQRNFLTYYKEEWHNMAPWPNLPPLPKASFAQ